MWLTLCTSAQPAGHSRGGKVSVLTATLDPRVTACCLLDPVDNTKYAPLSVDFPSAVDALKQLAMQVGSDSSGTLPVDSLWRRSAWTSSPLCTPSSSLPYR